MYVVAMFSMLLLISAAALTGADDFTIRCNNNSTRNGMSFEPVGEDIRGRYKLELCTVVKPEYKEWEVAINFYNKTAACNSPDYWKFIGQHRAHSYNVEYLHLDNNCTHACLTKNFDAIFTACYSIDNKFIIQKDDYPIRTPPITSLFNVRNSFTLDQFIANTATVEFIPHKKGITVVWHPGVPVQEFEVELCDANVTVEHEVVCENASARCARGDEVGRAVRCELPPPGARSCISLLFYHVAPWVAGKVSNQERARYVYCVSDAGQSPVGVRGASGWAGAGAAGCVLGAALLALLARHVWASRRAQRARKHVLRVWLQATRNEPTPQGGPSPPRPSRSILLLYARENDAGQRLIDALTSILQDATDGQVYDLHGVGVLCAAGDAPGEWLRAALTRPDLSLVLLQTPALRALYAAAPSTGGGQLTVSPSLFPGSVVPRVPSFGDGLLQYALRLLADTHTSHSYHKLYLATLTELPTEIFPQVVPYRRYLLPEAASLLAKEASENLAQPNKTGDIAADEKATSLLTKDSSDNINREKAAGNKAVPTNDEKTEVKNEVIDVKQELLTEAIAYFVEMVKENPSYLMEELVVL